MPEEEWKLSSSEADAKLAAAITTQERLSSDLAASKIVRESSPEHHSFLTHDVQAVSALEQSLKTEVVSLQCYIHLLCKALFTLI